METTKEPTKFPAPLPDSALLNIANFGVKGHPVADSDMAAASAANELSRREGCREHGLVHLP
jgi:hypothetical protein